MRKPIAFAAGTKAVELIPATTSSQRPRRGTQVQTRLQALTEHPGWWTCVVEA